MSSLEPTARTTVRRHRDRASYDLATIEAILDEGYICHVACSIDGTVKMIPTVYGRDGDRLLLHGAAGNDVLRAAAAGAELTVSVTLVDGLILARSVFHHSINYRSVVIYGAATEIVEPVAKERALARVVDHLLPGRSADARPPTPVELAATRVVELPIAEASAKIHTGGPADDEQDMDLPVWAGVIPLRTTAGDPDPAEGAPAYTRQPSRW